MGFHKMKICEIIILWSFIYTMEHIDWDKVLSFQCNSPGIIRLIYKKGSTYPNVFSDKPWNAMNARFVGQWSVSEKDSRMVRSSVPKRLEPAFLGNKETSTLLNQTYQKHPLFFVLRWFAREAQYHYEFMNVSLSRCFSRVVVSFRTWDDRRREPRRSRRSGPGL